MPWHCAAQDRILTTMRPVKPPAFKTEKKNPKPKNQPNKPKQKQTYKNPQTNKHQNPQNLII